MPWTTPKTWATGELVTAADLNTQVRDNLSFLKTKADAGSNRFKCFVGAPYNSTTSTTFVDVNAGNLSGSLTTFGGPVLIGASSTWNSDTNASIYLDVLLDSTRIGDANYGLLTGFMSNTNQNFPFTLLTIKDVAAGSHTFKLQWRVSAGTGRISGGYSPISFFAMELM